MTWSASGNVVKTEVTLEIPGEILPEATQQASVASKAIQAIVKSGALGDPQGEYYVSVVGHANPGHEPTVGWTNDHLSISITQATKVVTANE